MAYEFTPVCKSFTQAHTALVDSTDEGAKTAHDRKVFAALGKPFNEVKQFYTKFQNFLAEAKVQCKSNMDAIKAKFNDCQGHPDAGQLKLMKGSLQIITNFHSALGQYQTTLKTDLMDWRGGWDKECEAVVFSRQGLEAILGYRKMLIDKQASDWNPTVARLEQYVTRADALVLAAEKAAKTAPANDGAETLAKIKDAHVKAMSTGPKSVTTYMEKIDTYHDKLKTEAKKGIDPRDKPNAAKTWKIKEPMFAQMAGYSKDLSGASKTLIMLTKLIGNGIGKVAKDQQAAWKVESEAIKKDIGKLDSAMKKYPDLLKNMKTIEKQYQDAIHGK